LPIKTFNLREQEDTDLITWLTGKSLTPLVREALTRLMEEETREEAQTVADWQQLARIEAKLDQLLDRREERR